VGRLKITAPLVLGTLVLVSGNTYAESLPSAVSHVYYVSGGFSVSGAINESTVDPLLGFEVSASARVGFMLPWITVGGQLGGDSFGYVEAGAWAVVNLGVGYNLSEAGTGPYLFAGAPIPVRLGVWRRNWLITAQPYVRIQLVEGQPHEAGMLWKIGIPMF